MKRNFSTTKESLIFEKILFKLAREQKTIFTNVRQVPAFLPSVNLEYKLNNLFNSVNATSFNVLDNRIIKNELDIFQSFLSKIQQTKTDLERLELIKEMLDEDACIKPILLNQLILKIKDVNIVYALLFMIKKSGLINHVLSCTSSVYNSLLKISWLREHDPCKIEFILNEMTNNGIKADEETKAVFSNIIDKIEGKMKQDLRHLFTKIE